MDFLLFLPLLLILLDSAALASPGLGLERAGEKEVSPGVGISFLLEAFFGTQTGTRAMGIKASESTPRDGGCELVDKVAVLHIQWG